jgi:septal ring factor EnvC (AmiA/AmiB activator)
MTPEAWAGLRQAGWIALRHVASAIAVIAVLFAVARPHAQEFIKDTVNDRLNLLEMQMNDVRQSVRDQERKQDIMGADIGNIKEHQAETRRNTRMILQSLQGMRRELRED